MEIEEDAICPLDCGGRLQYQREGGCSCHISPPCSSCTDALLTCNSCGWQEERTYEPPSNVKYEPWVYKRPDTDLGNGKRIFDYDYDGSSGSTMAYKGRYEGNVTTKDILEYFGSGTFGHRGPYLLGNENGGSFTFTKITD